MNGKALRVKLESTTGRPFAGHAVSALFVQSVTIDPGGPALPVPGEASAPVSAEGLVTLDLPASVVPDAAIRVRVLAPDGQLLKDVEASPNLLDGRRPLVIEVEPKEYFPIQHNTDPAFGKPARIRGLVVDPSGKGRVSDRQVVIFAKGSGAAAAAPVAVARTDVRGHFSAPYPLGAFAEAHGVVDGGPPIPTRLADDGSFPERVVLGVELPGDPGRPGKEDCKCGSTVPRDPDAGDLVNSPETYSADAGGGHCVDITKPNRVLEEFDFYTIVRTTEPEIRGLTITEPPKVGIRDIVHVLDPKIFGFLVRSQPEEALFEPAKALAEPLEAARLTRARTIARTPGLDLSDPEALATRALVTTRPELDHLSEVIGLASLRLAVTPRPQPAPGDGPDLESVRIETELVKTLARDPDGFSLTRLAQAEIVTRKNDLVRLIELIGRKTPGRGDLSCSNVADWDDEPTVYQACTIAHGHILHLKQQWVADGYSLGDLLYSLPLAPCQKKQIVTIDWDRRESAARLESLEERELLSAHLSRDRDISEIANSSVRESMSGRSEASTSSFGAGLGIGAIVGPVGGLLGIGGGSSGASSTASQNSSRAASASSLQQLRDTTVQGASAVRNQRSTVIQTVRQGETMRVETEVVANHNHCHAITIEYFEVLRHFLVRQQLADVQECLLVPLLMSRFDPAKARRWREVLNRYLRDRRLARGFDALQRIADSYVGSDMPVGAYAEGQLTYLDGFLRIQFRIQRPRDNTDGSFLEASWTVLSWLGITPLEWWQSYLNNQQQRDRVFAEVLGPRIAEEITNGLRLYAVDEDDNETRLPVDLTLVSDFGNDLPLYVSLRLNADLPPLRRDRIKFVKIGTVVDTNAGPKNVDDILPAGSKIIVQSGQMGYRTAHITHDLFRHSNILNDLSGTDGVLVYTPLSQQELRRPRDEDREAANALLKHLNDHLEYYHRACWWCMDAQHRFLLLDGFIAPNSGGRSVASVVENRLVGIVGNCLVMPVARGFHLDPTFKQNVENPIDLLEHYQPTTPIAPLRLAVPTKGVFAESVMGSCNSCEKKDESRFWRWEESPCPDEPTAIQPVSTESRRAEPPDLTPQPFPQPIVAFQNVPAAPDPQGIAALTQLLGNPNLFRDITGLTENQKNALAGLQAALGTAQFFGGKAADLALQGSMRQDIDKALDKINEQHAAGAISDEQRGKLTEAALRSMIGGGTETPASNALTKEPEVKQALQTAGTTPGGEINLTRASADGTETVLTKTPGGGGAGGGAGARRFIIEESDLTADRRAFNARANDKSGRAKLSVRVPRLPAGGSIRWSVPPGQAGRYTLSGDPTTIVNTASGRSVTVIGLQPGLTAIDCEARDASGTVLESVKYPLSVPQFIQVTEDLAKFDAVLVLFKVDHLKSMIVTRAKEVADHLLSLVNVRTVWQVPPFSETVPRQFLAGGAGAGNITTVQIQGDPPTPSLVGGTVRPHGPAIFNEQVFLYPGGFDDPAASNDLDDATRQVVSTLAGMNFSSARMSELAVETFGRLFGETIAHECFHTLTTLGVAPIQADGHLARDGAGNPVIPNDILNQGGVRFFGQRTAIFISDMPNFPAEGTYDIRDFHDIPSLEIETFNLISQSFPTDPPTP
jgi:hypothetical protein